MGWSELGLVSDMVCVCVCVCVFTCGFDFGGDGLFEEIHGHPSGFKDVHKSFCHFV